VGSAAHLLACGSRRVSALTASCFSLLMSLLLPHTQVKVSRQQSKVFASRAKGRIILGQATVPFR
jgi:hypothetical protein